jgi:hypothetical protein
MASPTFVNGGTRTTTAAGTSLTPALPGSRVNGNILVAMVATGIANKTFTWPGDWTVILSHHDAGGPMAVEVAARIVDGTETAPAVTWSGSTSGQSKCWQFSGNLNTVAAAVDHGNENKANNNNGTATNPGLATLTNDALVALFWYGNNGTITGTPSGYSLGTSESNLAEFHEAVATAGNSSTAVSQAMSGSMRWVTFELEIRSQAPGVSGDGDLASAAATVEGDGLSTSTGTGALQAGDATVDGAGGIIGTGALASGASTVEGDGISGSTGTGALASGPASVDGTAPAEIVVAPPSLPAVVIVVVNR